MHACSCMGACAHVFMLRPQDNLRCHTPRAIHLILLPSRALSPAWGLQWARLTAQLDPETPVSILPALGLQACAPTPDFSTWVLGGSSSPGVCAASALPSRLPSFQPQALVRAKRNHLTGTISCLLDWLSSFLSLWVLVGKISTINPASSNGVQHFTGAQRPALRAGWVF